MKTILAAMLLAVANLAAADVLTQKLQQGLFEEEANHDLNAAIKAYEVVVQEADNQRKVVATAIFRLGECYRKLGRTNDAQAQYQRILRDYSDQQQLADLSRKHVPAQQQTTTGAAAAMDPNAVALLQQEIALAQQQVTSAEKQFAAGRGSLNEVLQAKQDALRLKRLLPENAAAGQQKALIGQQTALVQQLIDEVQQRVKIGQMAPGSPSELGLKRELLALQRELTGIGSVASASGMPAEGTQMTTVEAEELARVRTLAQNSPDLLQSAGKDGMSELQRAARDGHYKVVEFILTQKTNPNGPEHGSWPPLVLAAQRGHLRIVQLLLDKGANVNAAFSGAIAAPSYIYGQTALMAASESGFRSVVELLIDRGADPDQRSGIGATALHHAALKGHASIAELLLKRGSKPDVLVSLPIPLEGWPQWSKSGAAPLHLAADRGYTPVVELLLKAGASANMTNQALQTPLHVGVLHPVVCASLLDKGADPNAESRDGYTPLISAINYSRTDVVTLLLARGADVNRRAMIDPNSPQYPLHLALSKPIPLLKALLAAKPNVEVTNRQGVTPLWVAIEKNSVEAVDALLESGADPNRALFRIPPILAAVEKDADITRTLLKHGANPNVIGPSGSTPLSAARHSIKNVNASSSNDRNANAQYLARLNEMERMLLEHGASEHLTRLFTIDYTRPAWNQTEPPKVFFRGTNDYNRYTLFEFLALVFAANTQLAFPDLAHVTIERIESTNAKPSELAVDVEALLKANDCGKDMWLQWGDRISIPELDHALNEAWPGLPKEYFDLLTRCVTRHVQIVVKNETNAVRLTRPVNPPPSTVRVVGRASTSEAAPRMVHSFRLADVIYGANVLRASSDPTRVRVTRANANTTNRWEMDITKVQTSSGQLEQSKLWFQYDLWLRDGDTIEIPDR